MNQIEAGFTIDHDDLHFDTDFGPMPILDEDTVVAVQTIAEALLENAKALHVLSDVLMSSNIFAHPEPEEDDEEYDRGCSCEGPCYSC